jgi:hypothetical protein
MFLSKKTKRTGESSEEYYRIRHRFGKRCSPDAGAAVIRDIGFRTPRISLNEFKWKKYCSGLFELPIAA